MRGGTPNEGTRRRTFGVPRLRGPMEIRGRQLPHTSQPLPRRVQCFLPLRKVEAHEVMHRLAEEARSRHTRHTHFSNKPFRRVRIARKAERGNIEHHIVSPLRLGERQPHEQPGDRDRRSR